MHDRKISIVMATYNGEKFVRQQLESIRTQSLKANEVLICDDCSTDDTFQIIKQHISDNKLINWHLKTNAKNIGWKQSFWNLLHEAQNEFVFLSDQDDVWCADKIKKMTDTISLNSKVQLLASNFRPVATKDMVLLTDTKSDAATKLELPKQLSFDKDFLKVQRPGCSFLIKKNLLLDADKLWTNNQPHDFTLWNAAILNASAFLLDESLVYWRVHADSADFSRKFSAWEMIAHPLKFYSFHFDKKIKYIKFNVDFLSHCVNEQHNRNFNSLNKQYTFLTLRYEYLKKQRFFLFLKTVMSYKSDYDMKVFISDSYFIIGAKIFNIFK